MHIGTLLGVGLMASSCCERPGLGRRGDVGSSSSSSSSSSSHTTTRLEWDGWVVDVCMYVWMDAYGLGLRATGGRVAGRTCGQAQAVLSSAGIMQPE